MYTSLRNLPQNDFAKKIYVYLTCHRIYDAANLARRSRMHQLSLLLTQNNVNDLNKYLLGRQIEEWNMSGAIDEIDDDIVRLYLLLSGSPINRSVNICEGLRWQKAVALHLWYLTSSSQTLNAAVAMYERSFGSSYCYSNYPSPPYPTSHYFKHFDIQFHLMKLYSYNTNGLEEILNTFSHTSDPTDYRLAWLLLHTLSAFGLGRITEDARNHIHTSFAFQLENMGHYKWAVFVLMFIKDINVKKNLIRGVLERNLTMDIDKTSTENYLVKRFKISSEYLHVLKSHKSRSVDNYWATYRHLLYTKDWNGVHTMLMKKIMPELLLNEYYDLIEKILKDLEPMSHRIIDWRLKGGLFIDFVRIRKALLVDKEIRTTENAQKLYRALSALCRSLGYYRPKTALEIVCSSELSKHCMSYMKTLQEILNYDFDKIFEGYDSKIDDLVMPPDYKIEDLLDTINRFYFKK